MQGRWSFVAVAGLVMVLGISSASSLGTFDDVPLGAVTRPVDACQADAELLDVLGEPIPLSTPDLYSVTGVGLSNLTGDCTGTSPIVVVIGQDPWLVGDDEVLAVQRFDETSLSGPDPLVLDVGTGDVLDLLTLNLTTVVTEVRVAFCPGGATCT